jgi:hypothetical protein
MRNDDVVCSFCDARAGDIKQGSVFTRADKVAICTDCIQVCIEVLCARSGIVNFHPVQKAKTSEPSP